MAWVMWNDRQLPNYWQVRKTTFILCSSLHRMLQITFVNVLPLPFPTQIKNNDPQPVIVENNNTQLLRPFQLCERMTSITHEVDQQYARCPLLHNPPEETAILLLNGLSRYGQTANRLITFFHALQYARDNKMLLGIMQYNSWATKMLTEMWMSIQNVDNMNAKKKLMEESFCVKMFDADDDRLYQYREVRHITDYDEVKAMFDWRHAEGSFDDFYNFQIHTLRTLWKSYNNGTGFDIRQRPARDMCSAIDAVFGAEKGSAIFSLVHSRSLEGAGDKIMDMVSPKTGCDPRAALEMEPEYVKAILEPLGMMNHPIVFMTDHQRPEILERLMADPDIGPNILLIPSEASWIGGDITLATVASVFIGNPASSFSGFIAKSRVALGYNNNYIYRKRDEAGTWVNVCDDSCSFW